jgi:hypothetical protein
VLAPSVASAQRNARATLLDPVGTWRCVVYGNPRLGDERLLLSFAPDQSARIARHSDGRDPAWLRISNWHVVDGVLTFDDSRTGRHFTAALDHTRLSGEWRTYNLLGGWWCSQADSDSGPGIDILNRADATAENDTRRLIPEVMATPRFPIRAVREAREGRVVLCFVVEPSGEIFEPEFVELSDEIFRATSLDALMRSRYKAWDPGRDGGARPACRSFIYKLDYVY